mmetsp:Transcript_11964/g.43713  ORF Transcript_11964/g.43713 Transcript_11964/m.43713 type:complete len:203 (-) Transcript_11964:1496-2104(-)
MRAPRGGRHFVANRSLSSGDTHMSPPPSHVKDQAPDGSAAPFLLFLCLESILNATLQVTRIRAITASSWSRIFCQMADTRRRKEVGVFTLWALVSGSSTSMANFRHSLATLHFTPTRAEIPRKRTVALPTRTRSSGKLCTFATGESGESSLTDEKPPGSLQRVSSRHHPRLRTQCRAEDSSTYSSTLSNNHIAVAAAVVLLS